MRRWTTPDGLAFEGLQTGDGRIFAPGSFFWEDSENGWPLRYDREDDGAHAGAVMIGAADSLGRAEAEGDDGVSRITGEGWIDDTDNDDGAAAVRALDNGAPLGISVDMDDMAVEWVVSAEDVETQEVILLAASFEQASLTRVRRAVAAGSSNTALVWELWAPGIGRIARQVMEDLAGETLTAAAGDGDLAEDDMIVIGEQSMDEVLVRVTRARIRGATLVDIPAFDRAAIVLEAADDDESDGDAESSAEADRMDALLAAAIGSSSLPIGDRERAWNASAARKRMAGDGDSPDTARMRQGHFYLDSDADPDTVGAYKLPFADVLDGTLTAIPRGIFAAAGAIQGARGGANIPEGDVDRIKSKIAGYYGKMRAKFDDDSIVPPWDSSSADTDTAAASGEIELDDTEGCEECGGGDPEHGRRVVVAASAPMRPSADWFTQPEWEQREIVTTVDPETERTLRGVPMQYLDSGEIRGHIALWGQCHTGSGDGACILTPRSRLNYVPFHHGHVVLDDGTKLATGNLTMAGGHADGRLSFAGAVEHYDNTTAMVGQVRAGEDEFGVWVHGAGLPDVWADELQMRKLRAASPSGDWRTVGGGLELTATLAVCHPGFVTPRAALAASGEVVSLVAAGAREVAMLSRSLTPQGRRLNEIVEQAVARGIELYVQQQNELASKPGRDRLRAAGRARGVERLRELTPTA